MKIGNALLAYSLFAATIGKDAYIPKVGFFNRKDTFTKAIEQHDKNYKKKRKHAKRK
jgi:hypothetical protein